MLLLCMYMYTHNMQVPTSQHAWLYTLCHTPLMVVIAVQRAVVNSAHIHYNVTWWKCLRLSTPHNVSITVFGQLLQHIACQGLTQVGVCVCVCVCVCEHTCTYTGVSNCCYGTQTGTRIHFLTRMTAFGTKNGNGGGQDWLITTQCATRTHTYMYISVN